MIMYHHWPFLLDKFLPVTGSQAGNHLNPEILSDLMHYRKPGFNIVIILQFTTFLEKPGKCSIIEPLVTPVEPP
jgi:hypothetical protein